MANFPANWYKANLFCRQYGYQLAIVDSAAKQAAIQHEIEQYDVADRSFWISGTRLADPQQWSWMSNGQPLDYANWLTDGPEHLVESAADACVRIAPHRGQQWEAFPCTAEVNFVCEETK